ncbi:MAG: Uma2 family endonuclease [Chloroflexota bacterium]|nr:Uma2 family endonuclease [Chloroflexota bacterium]
MEVKKRLYTVDDVLELQGWDGARDRKYELINGELIEMSPANLLHNWLAFEIAGEIRDYLKQHDIGYGGVEGGYSPPDDRQTLLAPDVAFVSKERMPDPIPQTFAGFMPDLAVEIASPSNSVRELNEKAEFYLRNGTELVWILYPENSTAEVCRLGDDGQIETQAVGIDGKLDGEDILPGLELELRQLFGGTAT